MSKDQNENSNVNANLPDMEICAARQVFDDRNYEAAECLVDHPSCDYMLLFGYNLALCSHPQRKEIVEKTQTRSTGN